MCGEGCPQGIDISLAEEGRDGEVRHYDVIPGALEALAKVVRAVRAPDCGRLQPTRERRPAGQRGKPRDVNLIICRIGAPRADDRSSPRAPTLESAAMVSPATTGTP